MGHSATAPQERVGHRQTEGINYLRQVFDNLFFFDNFRYIVSYLLALIGCSVSLIEANFTV